MREGQGRGGEGGEEGGVHGQGEIQGQMKSEGVVVACGRRAVHFPLNRSTLHGSPPPPPFPHQGPHLLIA